MSTKEGIESQEDIFKLEEDILSDKEKRTRLKFYEQKDFKFSGFIFKNIEFKSTFYNKSSIKFENCIFIDCKIRQFNNINIKSSLFNGNINFENIKSLSITSSYFYFTEENKKKISLFECNNPSVSNCYIFGNGCYSMINTNDCKNLEITNSMLENCFIFIKCVKSSFKIKNCTIKNLRHGFHLKNSEGFIKNVEIINIIENVKHDHCRKSNLEWENCPMITLDCV